MINFFFSFLINILLVLLGILGSFFTITNILKNKIKKAYYILVIILLPCSIIIFYSYTLPQIKDIPSILKKQYSTTEGICESTYNDTTQHKYIILNKQKFYYNPWSFKPKVNKKYRLYYAPNSKIIIKFNNLSKNSN